MMAKDENGQPRSDFERWLASEFPHIKPTRAGGNPDFYQVPDADLAFKAYQHATPSPGVIVASQETLRLLHREFEEWISNDYPFLAITRDSNNEDRYRDRVVNLAFAAYRHATFPNEARHHTAEHSIPKDAKHTEKPAGGTHYGHYTSVTFDGHSNFQLNFSGSTQGVQEDFEKSCVNRKAIWATLLDQKTGRTIASYNEEHGLQIARDAAVSGVMLAEMLDEHHSDEWAGAKVASAVTRAIERMTFSEEQYATLAGECSKLGPNFKSLAPNKSSPGMG